MQPNTYQGKELKTGEDRAEAWHDNTSKKFTSTDREQGRGPLPDLGPASDRMYDVPSDEILEVCLAALKNQKAPGRKPTDLWPTATGLCDTTRNNNNYSSYTPAVN